MSWLPAKYSPQHRRTSKTQAYARLHRQGQSKPVNVYHLITENTIDEDVIKSIASKASGQESLMRAIRARLNKKTILPTKKDLVSLLLNFQIQRILKYLFR